MKSIVISLLLWIICMDINAQTRIYQKAPSLDSLIVKDAAGVTYTKTETEIMIRSGKYMIRYNGDNKTALIMPSQAFVEEFGNMPKGKPAPSKFFKTGDKMAQFSERAMNGVKYSLKELAGKVVVLNFWFINCPPCRGEMPELNKIVTSYKDSNVVFIAIALDEKYEIENFLKTNPFTYNIIDGGRYIASKYGVTLYPTHVVLNKQGKILFHTSGYSGATITWLKKAINAGLNDSSLE